MTILSRSYSSTHQLWAAELAGAQAKALEDNWTEPIPAFSIEQRAYVMNAIFMSTAFLDAAISEVIQDIVDDHRGYIGQVSPVVSGSVAKWWMTSRNGRSAGPILTRYHKLSKFYGLQPMPRGSHEDVALLVDLRNELMHYKPKTLGGNIQHVLAATLPTKFALNPLLKGSPGNPIFPDHCLASPCAVWATTTTRSFADTYFALLGISPNYQRPMKWPMPADVAVHRMRP